MASDLVLLTGGSGHIGFGMIIALLKAGYSVRAAVRTQSKADIIREHQAIKTLDPASQRLTYSIVPDILAPNAYDEAVRGASLVVHGATPLPLFGLTEQEDFHEKIIKPTVEGTVAMLTSAARTSSVRRIVLLSSFLAHIPFANCLGGEESQKVFSASDYPPQDDGPYIGEYHAYVAAKAKARVAAIEYVKSHTVQFDVVSIAPSFVLGPNLLAQTSEEALTGSNSVPLAIATGTKFDITVAGCPVHLDDLTYVMVHSLDVNKIPGGSTFLVSSDGPEGVEWEHARGVVSKYFPNAVANNVLSNDGHVTTQRVRVETENTESIFDFKYKEYEEQVVDVV
ncbi:MAG: hypothetical protein M1828_006240 [Chrysothrix sp. TS-e1954]|nr:MAG: hypothetical protein M1828_006240 [Chrysothrix sp. TS-e1954]